MLSQWSNDPHVKQMKSHTSRPDKNQLSTEMFFFFLLLPPLNPNLKIVRSILNQLLLLGQRRQIVTWITQTKTTRIPLHVVHGLASGSPPATETGISEWFSRLPHIKCSSQIRRYQKHRSSGTAHQDRKVPIIWLPGATKTLPNYCPSDKVETCI